MFQVEFSKKADRQLNKLPIELQKRIIIYLERIRIRPFHYVKKLQGTPYYRVRVGEYRIILDIQENKLIVFILEIGHRRNIYKN